MSSVQIIMSVAMRARENLGSLEVADEEFVGTAASTGLATLMVGHNAAVLPWPRLNRPGAGSCRRVGRPGGAGKLGRRAVAG